MIDNIKELYNELNSENKNLALETLSGLIKKDEPYIRQIISRGIISKKYQELFVSVLVNITRKQIKQNQDKIKNYA